VNRDFKEGQLVACILGDTKDLLGVRIGVFKAYHNSNSAFVYYHSGGTAALTPLKALSSIDNVQYISSNTLGGKL